MNIKILCIGKIKEKFYTAAINEYSKRLSGYTTLSIIELPECKVYNENNETEIETAKTKEGKTILSKIKDKDNVISLCIEGNNMDSVSFSGIIEKSMSSGCDLVFVIGGSYGLSDEIKKRSNSKLSFSKMTFPHQLMRVILLEQIYRGFKIYKKEKYHK